MKIALITIFLLFSTVSFAESCGEELKGRTIKKIYPVTGTTLLKLNSFLKVAQKYIKDKNIIDITIYNDRCIFIKTGIIRAPLNGSGVNYNFEKNNGMWVLESESQWVS